MWLLAGAAELEIAAGELQKKSGKNSRGSANQIKSCSYVEAHFPLQNHVGTAESADHPPPFHEWTTSGWSHTAGRCGASRSVPARVRRASLLQHTAVHGFRRADPLGPGHCGVRADGMRENGRFRTGHCPNADERRRQCQWRHVQGRLSGPHQGSLRRKIHRLVATVCEFLSLKSWWWILLIGECISINQSIIQSINRSNYESIEPLNENESLERDFLGQSIRSVFIAISKRTILSFGFVLLRQKLLTSNRSINQSIHPSINRSINQSINQSINRSINWSDQPAVIPLASSQIWCDRLQVLQNDRRYRLGWVQWNEGCKYYCVHTGKVGQHDASLEGQRMSGENDPGVHDWRRFGHFCTSLVESFFSL